MTLKSHLSLEIVNVSGNTAFDVATAYGKLDVVKWLIKTHNVDLSSKLQTMTCNFLS